MQTPLALIALFQLAVPNSGTALISYPTLGYTLTTTGVLIRLAGIPGACYATPDPTEPMYRTLQTASAERASLLTPAGDTPSLIYRTPLNDTTVRLTETPLMSAISPSGAYFAALSPAHLWLYRRNGSAALGASDANRLPVPLADITSILVGDDGDLVLSTSAGFWYSAAQINRVASAFTQVSVPVTFLRFAPRDHLLVGYEAGQGRVIALHPSSGFAIEPLTTRQDLLGAVTGLEFGADPMTIWVTQQAGNLLSYNLLRRALDSYPVAPGVLGPVTAPGVFLWSQPGSSISVLDTTRDVPTVLVVPTTQRDPSK